ncbi:MAG: FHA domain-containing protein [Gemmataceae bacterium]|nr:FHA domain-containing protein [Gemmataceae bacterium]
MEAHKPGQGQPGPRLHEPGHTDIALPEGFVPLRLLLQPGGLCLELNRPDMMLGRHSEADLRLALPDVSRRHCRFCFEDQLWQVTDLNSLNGTFINDERLDVATLHHGDRIRIASLTFVVDLSGETNGPRSGVLRSIADVLPGGPGTEQRKAS